MFSGKRSKSRLERIMKLAIRVFCKIIGVLLVYMILMRWVKPSLLLSLWLRLTEVYQPSS